MSEPQDNIVTVSTSSTQVEKPVEKEVKTPVSAEKVEETTEDSETSEELEGSGESDEITDENKSQSGVKKRIGKLLGKLSQKDIEIAKRDREIELLKAGTPKPEQKEPEKKADADGKPKAGDFENYSDYLEALSEYSAANVLKKSKDEEKVQTDAQKAESQFQERLKTHNSRVDEFKKVNADFDQTVSDFIEEHGAVFSETMRELILESDQGPAITYELVKNKAEFDRLNSLSPLAAAREFGKLEAGLSKPPEEKETKTTKAPTPPTPIGKKAAGSIKKSIYDKDLSFAEYERLMEEEEKQQRRNA